MRCFLFLSPDYQLWDQLQGGSLPEWPWALLHAWIGVGICLCSRVYQRTQRGQISTRNHDFPPPGLLFGQCNVIVGFYRSSWLKLGPVGLS